MKRLSCLRPLLAMVAACAALPLQAAQQPFRLQQIFVYRTVEHQGAPAMQRGMLHAHGMFEVIDPNPFPPTGTIPPEAMNKYLIPVPIWFGYEVLGLYSLANYDDVLIPIDIGEQAYFEIAPKVDPKLDTGTLLNLSARSIIMPGTEPLIGGFIVEDRPRRVLIRCVGPTLDEHSVTAPLPDPVLALFRQGEDTSFATNDDWEQQQQQQPNAGDVAEAIAEVGAFPLRAGSKDAAIVLTLAPGAYTAHLGTPGTIGGTALLEIYTLP